MDPAALTGHFDPAFVHAWIGKEGQTFTWWQMSVRASIVFAFGIALLRLARTRLFGKASAFDIVLSVIVGSNLSRTLTGNAPFFETLIATIVLVLLHALMATLAHRWKPFATLVKGAPMRLIEDGTIDDEAMARERIGERDLKEALRGSGVENAEDVRLAVLERDGSISVVKR